jgi:hypothetical protein
MNCIVKMGSGAMIHISSLIKVGLGIQNLLGRDTHTDSHVVS